MHSVACCLLSKNKLENRLPNTTSTVAGTSRQKQATSVPQIEASERTRSSRTSRDASPVNTELTDWPIRSSNGQHRLTGHSCLQPPAEQAGQKGAGATSCPLTSADRIEKNGNRRRDATTLRSARWTGSAAVRLRAARDARAPDCRSAFRSDHQHEPIGPRPATPKPICATVCGTD